MKISKPEREKGEVLGTVAIHVDDLLISGSSEFTDYISLEMKENSRRIDMAKIKRLIRARVLGKRAIRMSTA